MQMSAWRCEEEAMSGATKKLFDGAEVAEVLSGTYYKAKPQPELRAVAGGAEERPQHYKVICISLYNEDLARLDGMVEELKKRGFTKANRSALIRFALEQADLDKVKKGM
jgi:hypothetical protein